VNFSSIGELLQRLLAKVILHVVGPEANATCDNLNLCAGLKAGIEGAISRIATTIARPSRRSSYYPDVPQSVSPALPGRLDGILTQPEFSSPADDARLALADDWMVDADGDDHKGHCRHRRQELFQRAQPQGSYLDREAPVTGQWMLCLQLL
jgi:hypothetical protein